MRQGRLHLETPLLLVYGIQFHAAGKENVTRFIQYDGGVETDGLEPLGR